MANALLRRAALLGIAAIFVASCASDDTTESVAPGATQPSGATTTVAEQFDTTAKLTVGSNTWDSFDPTVTTLASVAGRWLNPVYDLLVNLKPDGTFGPGLATSWSFVNVDGGSALQLKLRTGVQFHDGTPFDAAAVKANIDRALASTGSIRSYLRTIDSVAVVDPTTVNLKLKPNSGYNTLWGLSMTGGRMVSPAAFATAATKPVGTGPFIFQSMTTDTVTYTRNDNYWGEKAKYQTLVIQSLSSNNTPWINGVISGSLDVGKLVGPSEAELNQVKAAGNVKVEQLPVGQFDYISMNRTKAPFNDPKVRQAVAYALDYDGMTKALGYEPIRQPAVASASVYDKALNTKYTYDPAKAKALLAEAGYKDGLDVGEMIFTVSGTIPKLAQVAQESLKAVGITVKLRQLDGAAQVAQLCGTGQAECKMLAFSVITWDPLYIAETFLLPPKGGANLGGEAATGDLAKKLALAQQPASQQEHDTYLKDLIATMSAETINVFTGLVPTYAIYRSDVRNVASGWFIEGHPNHGLLGVVKK